MEGWLNGPVGAPTHLRQINHSKVIENVSHGRGSGVNPATYHPRSSTIPTSPPLLAFGALAQSQRFYSIYLEPFANGDSLSAIFQRLGIAVLLL